MNYRQLIVIFTLLLLPLSVWADGLAYGKGFTRQLQETHQLAVINLDETTADVSMFIAIEGIPAGEELTYILPFWYKPIDFTMTEEDAKTFRETRVAPANEKVVRMKRLSEYEGSGKLLEAAGLIVGGYITSIIFPTFGKNGAGISSSGITGLIPYATDETAHARAELFEIGNKDLQQLIQQSGLPEELLKPLQKYKTPYFAVMHLKGLTVDESQQQEMSGKGVRYHFTHQLTGGKYIYPLGTGAAWPQPIPFTEVYITCPERLVMQVTAPTEGERLHWRHFSSKARELAAFLSCTPEEKANILSDKDNSKKILTPATSSLLGTGVKRTFAWNIAYMQSNPSEDISVQLSKQSQMALMRLRIADFFATGNAIFICLLLSLISWIITARLVIRRQWLRQGSPGKLLKYQIKVSLKAALFIPVIGSLFICIILIVVLAAENTLAAMAILAIVLILAILLYIRGRSAKESGKTDSWRDLPILIPWLSANGIFILLVVLLAMFVAWCEKV